MSNTDNVLKQYGIDKKFSHLSYGEISQKLKDAAKHTKGFCRACIDDNSIKELQTTLTEEANVYDMKQWCIDEQEWREAIEQALLALIGFEICDVLDEAEQEWWDNN